MKGSLDGRKKEKRTAQPAHIRVDADFDSGLGKRSVFGRMGSGRFWHSAACGGPAGKPAGRIHQ